jgi:hypothetical protein
MKLADPNLNLSPSMIAVHAAVLEALGATEIAAHVNADWPAVGTGAYVATDKGLLELTLTGRSLFDDTVEGTAQFRYWQDVVAEFSWTATARGGSARAEGSLTLGGTVLDASRDRLGQWPDFARAVLDQVISARR